MRIDVVRCQNWRTLLNISTEHEQSSAGAPELGKKDNVHTHADALDSVIQRNDNVQSKILFIFPLRSAQVPIENQVFCGFFHLVHTEFLCFLPLVPDSTAAT